MSDLLTLAVTITLIGLGLTVMVFLLFRAFWLWYWRVDEQVALLRRIATSLEQRELRAGLPLPPATPSDGTRPAVAPLAPAGAASANWEIAPLTSMPESLLPRSQRPRG